MIVLLQSRQINQSFEKQQQKMINFDRINIATYLFEQTTGDFNRYDGAISYVTFNELSDLRIFSGPFFSQQVTGRQMNVAIMLQQNEMVWKKCFKITYSKKIHNNMYDWNLNAI